MLDRCNATGDSPASQRSEVLAPKIVADVIPNGPVKINQRAATWAAKDRWCCKLESTSSAAFQSPRHAGSNRVTLRLGRLGRGHPLTPQKPQWLPEPSASSEHPIGRELPPRKQWQLPIQPGPPPKASTRCPRRGIGSYWKRPIGRPRLFRWTPAP